MGRREGQHRDRSVSEQRNRQAKDPPSLMIPIVVGVVVVIMVAGAIVASGNRHIQTPTAPVVTVPPQSTLSIPYPDVPRISLQETTDRLAQGQAILVDVRSKSSFDSAHAAGALSIPEGEIASRLNELPRDKELILYCT